MYAGIGYGTRLRRVDAVKHLLNLCERMRPSLTCPRDLFTMVGPQRLADARPLSAIRADAGKALPDLVVRVDVQPVRHGHRPRHGDEHVGPDLFGVAFADAF